MTTALNQQNKQRVRDFWQGLESADAGQYQQTISRFCDADLIWHGPAPINELQGAEAVSRQFWQPLVHAFPDIKRDTFIFMGGQSNGRVDGDMSRDGHTWVSGTGTFTGTFRHDYLTIAATGKAVKIRWGEFCKIQQDKITEIFCLLDLVDLMQQAGIHVLPPALGKDGRYPAPHAGDGMLHESQDASTSAYSLEHIRRFIFDGLNNYDQRALSSMGVADFFHPEIQWYGPGGIGACDGLQAFEHCHQQPWLTAFPDRLCGNIDALYAEGCYTAAAGWGDVKATHAGEYKGVAATGNPIAFNGLDWWKRDGDLFMENWVFVDMIHLFRQFGIDLLAHERR